VAAQQRPDSSLELAHLERLDEVIVSPRVETVHLVVERVARREHQQRRVIARLVAELAADRDPVEPGQHQVEHDHVVGVRDGEMQPRDAVRRVVHRHTVQFETLDDHLRNVAVVLDEQHGGVAQDVGHGRRPPRKILARTRALTPA